MLNDIRELLIRLSNPTHLLWYSKFKQGGPPCFRYTRGNTGKGGVVYTLTHQKYTPEVSVVDLHSLGLNYSLSQYVVHNNIYTKGQPSEGCPKYFLGDYTTLVDAIKHTWYHSPTRANHLSGWLNSQAQSTYLRWNIYRAGKSVRKCSWVSWKYLL